MGRATGQVGHRLDRDAFNRPTLVVARDLIGKFIVRCDGAEKISAMIIEVEAYKGPRDRASHAFGGRRTHRVEPLYGEGGTAYVYLVYGLHWLFNISTAGRERPEGILIRGIMADIRGAPTKVLGPGKVSRYLRIDKELDRVDVTESRRVWLEDRGAQIPASRINTGPRIGIDYAGSYWAARRWRFWIDAIPSCQ